jgi:hypothetical protein
MASTNTELSDPNRIKSSLWYCDMRHSVSLHADCNKLMRFYYIRTEAVYKHLLDYTVLQHSRQNLNLYWRWKF